MQARLCGIVSSVLLACLLVGTGPCAAKPLPAQTDVHRAEHLLDTQGVPFLDIEGVGVQYHPAWVALYALAYADIEHYDHALDLTPDKARFRACVGWLVNHLARSPQGDRVWMYDFDNTYNDLSIRAPWWSAFGQATGIQALLASYRLDGNQEHLRLAREAALVLTRPVEEGGLAFISGSDVWFEEVPLPAGNPSHILNGHMRALLALRELTEATADPLFRDWFDRGLATLERWLWRYDTGYWLRYDLNPRKSELLFRFANPYGFRNQALAIDRIRLRDPTTGRSTTLNLGTTGDMEGSSRVAGIHWGQQETLDGRNVRRLIPSPSGFDPTEPHKAETAPHTYFYLSLPEPWEDNLRKERLELEIEYYDESPGTLTVQLRSIAPGIAFRDMRDGDLLLTGAHHWRKWMIPLRTTDLGYWVGSSYAAKHAAYLRELAPASPRIARWAVIAEGYERAANPVASAPRIVAPRLPQAPDKAPQPAGYVRDSRGVVTQSLEVPASRSPDDTESEPTGRHEIRAYSPYVIASQLMDGLAPFFADPAASASGTDARAPALAWFADPGNQKRSGDAILYQQDIDAIYNDVVARAPRASAFDQAHVLKALSYASDRMPGGAAAADLLPAVALAYGKPVGEGGLASRDRANRLFFEDVPNRTHVLNAHLLSTAELTAVARRLRDGRIALLAQLGTAALQDLLWRYDTGYWLQYDQNPMKSILFQLDWLEGSESPLVDEIVLENPQTGTATRIDVGADDRHPGRYGIVGADWLQKQQSDGRPARAFRNGYLVRPRPLDGGTRHNVYLTAALPEQDLVDLFDLPDHRLVIRYKDRAPGLFGVAVRNIAEKGEIDFVPLRNGLLRTRGDGLWKEAFFQVRPRDMGWPKDADLQAVEVRELRRIANLTNNPLLYQHVERQEYFLDLQRQGAGAGAFLGASIVDDGIIDPPSVWIARASETYDGHGFENALDGDGDDDYVAGREGATPAHVVLAWKRPVLVEGVRIRWESTHNRARLVTLSRVGADLDPADILPHSEEEADKETSLLLSEATLLNALRLDLAEFEGQPRVLLRQIEVLAKEPAIGDLSQFTWDRDGDFLAATDLRNPLYVLRVPISNNVKALSDSLIRGSNSDHEKVMRLMQALSRFSVGIATGASPEATLTERTGACGTFSSTLLALAASQGIQGRLVNLHNYPPGSGHTVVELFVDGAWRLYDPTYGAYYLDPTDKSSGLLSFEKIRRGFRRGDPIETHVTIPRTGAGEFTGREIFRQANPASVLGPHLPMVFPLSLGIGRQEVLTRKEFGTLHQGAELLGNSGWNQQQEWRLEGLSPGRVYAFSVFPAWLGGDLEGREQLFEMRAQIAGGAPVSEPRHVFHFDDGRDGPWDILFRAHAPEARVRLWHPYLGPHRRYVIMDRYELNPLQ